MWRKNERTEGEKKDTRCSQGRKRRKRAIQDTILPVALPNSAKIIISRWKHVHAHASKILILRNDYSNRRKILRVFFRKIKATKFHFRSIFTAIGDRLSYCNTNMSISSRYCTIATF